MENLLQGLNIYLIGMMGVGKTTIGQLLAEKLNYRFLDTDAIIETVTQKTIQEIFAQEGEANFRALETEVLQEVSGYIRSVIATGGGIILDPHNWSFLHYGLIVWLDAPIDLLTQRLAEDQTRPLLQEVDLKLKLESLLKQRKSLYAQADLRISLQPNQTPREIVAEIIQQIPSKIKPEFKATLN